MYNTFCPERSWTGAWTYNTLIMQGIWNMNLPNKFWSTLIKLLFELSNVLTLDSNSEIGAHVRSKLCYLTCLSHLIKSRPVTSQFGFVFSEKKCFPSCIFVMLNMSFYQTIRMKSTLVPCATITEKCGFYALDFLFQSTTIFKSLFLFHTIFL